MTEFGDSLRQWRTRRRVSQLELALRAGTTQRHVSFLETGRSTPGPDMVVRVAESLDLTLRDRNALLLTAGYAARYPDAPLDDPTLAPVMESLRRLLDAHEPYPAIVVDRFGDLVAANRGFAPLVDGVDPALLEPPVNTIRLALHPGGLAPRITNVRVWAGHVLEGVRRQHERAPDPRHLDLLAEVATYLPTRTTADDGDAGLGVAVPMQLRTRGGTLNLITAITTFTTAVDVEIAELRLETFLPADAATATALMGGQRTE